MKKFLFVLMLIGVLTLPGIVLAADIGTMATTLQGKMVIVGTAVVVIGWIITGILFLTAAGNPETLGKAKKALIACVIGTAVIIIAATAEDFITSTLGM